MSANALKLARLLFRGTRSFERFRLTVGTESRDPVQACVILPKLTLFFGHTRVAWQLPAAASVHFVSRPELQLLRPNRPPAL